VIERSERTRDAVDPAQPALELTRGDPLPVDATEMSLAQAPGEKQG
jgi:hypothetical protein